MHKVYTPDNLPELLDLLSQHLLKTPLEELPKGFPAQGAQDILNPECAVLEGRDLWSLQKDLGSDEAGQRHWHCFVVTSAKFVSNKPAKKVDNLVCYVFQYEGKEPLAKDLVEWRIVGQCQYAFPPPPHRWFEGQGEDDPLNQDVPSQYKEHREPSRWISYAQPCGPTFQFISSRLEFHSNSGSDAIPHFRTWDVDF